MTAGAKRFEVGLALTRSTAPAFRTFTAGAGEGGLGCIGEVGADDMMKVNGLPLGNAPLACGK